MATSPVAPDALIVAISRGVNFSTFDRISSVCSPSKGERFTSVMLSDSPTEVIRSPLLGEHTDEVLAELGYTNAQIESLRSEKVI